MPLRTLLIPAKIESITKVSSKLRIPGNICHDVYLKKANEKQHLEHACGGDGIGAIDGSNAIRDISKIVVEVNLSGKVVASTSDKITNKSELGNTSMFEFNVTESVKRFLVGTV